MSEPIVFISHHGVKPGKRDDLEQYLRRGVPSIEAEKPETVVFLAYLDDAGSEASFVHVFPDAQAMDLHLEGAEVRARGAYEYLEPRRFEIYGSPGDGALEMMRQSAARTGVDLVVRPRLVDGYVRPAAG